MQDSFQALERLGVEKLKLKTKIVFEGEAGIDSGGLTKDWFLQLSRGLFNPQFCLLKKHETKVYHIDSRSGINEEHLKYFHFQTFHKVCTIFQLWLFDFQVIHHSNLMVDCNVHLTKLILQLGLNIF